MAQELSHTISQSNWKRNGMASIKIDMRKAFDRVNWNFHFCVLSKLDFPTHWIHLIKECVTYFQYFVLVNGQVTDPFKPSYGLRQEDPLPQFYLQYAQKHFPHRIFPTNQRKT
ncbi:hypothetical protein LIER_07379 [Lithospermum erythrorhizon]|uniref:Reverse transcriptase domain-containing protein n=1 Tax=Lithospermum erythrorhizon TaxID=34254 RepID=A0AAV3PAL2_LITER